MKKLLLLLFALAVSVTAQVSAPQIQYVTTNPTGNACGATNIALRTPNGLLYTCQSGTYALAFSGSGTGCTTAGAAGEILVDDGAGGCTSTAPKISGTTITASLTGHASLDLPLTGGTLTGNLLFSTDNTRDIGASGATRPRDFFLGRNALVGGTLGVTGNLTINVATGTQCLHASSAGVVSGTGSDCGSGGGGITIGTTTITSGTTTRILYDNGGLVGEYTLTGSGTVAVMQNTPTLITPVLGAATGTSLSLTGGITTGTGGSVAGFADLGAGAAHTATGVGFQAPAAITTPFMMTLPALPATGVLLSTGTTDPATITFVPALSTNTASALVRRDSSGDFAAHNITVNSCTGCGGSVSNFYTSTVSTGIGPTSFTPTHTLDVFDATASTGVTAVFLKAGAAQSSSKELTITDNSDNPIFTFDTDTAAHLKMNFTGSVDIFTDANTTRAVSLYGGGSPLLALGAPAVIQFYPNLNIDGGAADTGISRDSAGVIDIGTGAQGSAAGTLKAATINIGNSSFTFNGHTCTIVSTVVTCP